MLSGPALAVPDAAIDAFQEARSLQDADPLRAYEVAKTIPKIERADDARISLLAETALGAAHVEEAIGWIKKLEAGTSDSTNRFKYRLERAELLALLGNQSAAEGLLDELQKGGAKLKVRRSADRRFLKSRLLRLQHDIALGKKDNKTAKRRAVELLIFYPAEKATAREGLVIGRDDLSRRQKYTRANQLMDSWGYHLARIEYQELVKYKEYSETAKWNLALIGLRKLRDDPVGAEVLFKELVSSKKRGEQALYYVARAQMRQEKYDEARATMSRYAKKYPKGSNILNVDYYRGWLYYDHRENEKALVGFEEFVDKYGRRSRKSSYIYGFRAWALMRLERWQDAVKAWESMFPFGNPLVEGKARYWKSYALVKLGKNDEALASLDKLRKRWPLTYYSMLGEQLRAQIEGKSPKASEVWWPEGGGNLDDSPRIDVAKYRFKGLPKGMSEDWKRVKVLAQIGEKHLARETLKGIYDELLRRIPQKKKNAWIHALGWFVGDYNKMWNKVKRGGISGGPGSVVPDKLESAMLYPRAYKGIVDDVATEFGIYPAFVWSIMRQESRYKPGAISYTDAVGALQMIPKTARKVARDLGTVFNVATFFRPEVGFRFSGFYMRKILDTFDGLWVPAAASYNSGPEVVAKWFRKNPNVEFAWLIEEFEYNEGRAYCRKVNEHLLRYLYLYEADVEVRAKMLDKMFPTSRDIEIPEDVGY